MIATWDDVTNGLMDVWNTRGVTALVPGGVFRKGIPTPITYPFATLKAVPGERVTASSGTYLETWRVTARVYGIEGTHNRGAIEEALARLDRSQADWSVEDYGRAVHVRAAVPEDVPDPDFKPAADVFTVVMAWDVLIQQTRPG